jgi:beta-mannosidase
MKQIESLNGEWSLVGFREGSRPCSNPSELTAMALPTIPATVPGNVELDMQRSGIIDSDPFIGDNCLALAQYEGWEWWYRRTFNTLTNLQTHTFLRFDGLDCIADIWLNSVHLGRRENMLISHEFDVTGALLPEGENELVVRLGSAVNRATDYDYPDSVDAMHSNMEQLYIRKAPHMYGWDIMPRILSAGIWRDVTLVTHGAYSITDAHYRAFDVSEDAAGLHVRYRIDSPSLDWDRMRLRLVGVCGDSRFTTEVPIRFAAGSLNVHVAKPALWWPRGYGEAALYEVVLELLLDDDIVDSRTEQIGLREIVLERTEITEPSALGQFLFRVNGTPILVKGTNWVPLDAFHSRDEERLPQAIALLAESGSNMVRCWGGNVYEDDLFFEECDRLGIMVWQDFAMACARYPQDDDFANRLTEETESVVRRLRNHACIALWAGDNECDDNHYSAGMDPNENRSTRRVIPEVLHRLDPWRPYVPCSPYFSPMVVARGNTDLAPDQHLWGPRDYYKSRFYTESQYHFVSEIGYHGCPNRSSLEAFLPADSVWPWQDNRFWRIHAADTSPEPGPYAYRIELMAKQVGELFGEVPEDLDSFILASQISQAEAKKFFIEMTRLRKWRRTGVLWWNLIDGWPQFSDAVVDYYGGVKLAYHYIRRAQQPVCIMIAEPEDWRCAVVLGNDSLQRASGKFRVSDSDGTELLSGGFDVAPNENAQIGGIPVSRGAQRLFLMEWELGVPIDGQVAGGNHYLLGTPPFRLQVYREWLNVISSVPPEFDAQTVGQ